MHDVVIIGGGIVGLATAWRLVEQQPSLKVCVLEKEKEVASHQTGHNSGVIHSGIYYRPGTLRARNCIEGYHDLMTFAAEHNIAHDICGKVIVATREQERPQLDKILGHGLQNGLTGIRKIPPEEAREKEPHINVVEALWVPQTGIIDYVAVAKTYVRLIEAQGSEVHTNCPVINIIRKENEVTAETPTAVFTAKILVNCAGLYSDRVAAMTGQDISDIRILPFRGEYYQLKPEKQYLVNNLIYPVPNPDFPFLGVHYTRMIHGGIEAGPNAVLAFRREGYSRWDFHAGEFFETIGYPGFRKMAQKQWRYGLDELYRSYSKAAFVRALQHLIPSVTADDLERGGAGVRAMACNAQGQLSDEFLIFEDKNVVNVCNAPSPAATASLAIGKTIAGKVFDRL